MESIPITFRSDEKGYFDRECPNENCLYTFKVYMSDWENKFSDDEVHCPMCGHIAPADSWWTEEQLDAMREMAKNYAMDLIGKKLDEAFSGLARSTRHNKYLKFTYKPGRRVSFVNSPIGQREEWETDITCEVCGTRYSVIGSAYFCPCCGHNSVIAVFDESMDTVEKMVDSLSEVKAMLERRYGRDKAETMCRDMREDTLGNIVSAFQKFAEGIYKRKSTKDVKVNDFQIVEKGSRLFLDAVGKGYDTWLSSDELARMNLLFQKRHILEHNNGIVDDRYLQKSGDTSYVLGQRIVVHDTDANELLTIIKKLSSGLKTI